MDNSNAKGNHFFAFLSRMKYINRWGLMRNTHSENISEHSLQVAFIAHALAIIKNTYFAGNINPDRVAVMAMFHDCSEIFTGDMPTPVKYYSSEIKRAYKDIEKQSNEKLINMLPQELQGIYEPLFFNEDNEMHLLIKAADKLSAYIKCLEEESAGNSEFKRAKQAQLESIRAMGLKEADYFLDIFVPSFTLTLDDME